MPTSQDIRSKKRPVTGANRLLPEHSFSENAGDDVVTAISDYNTYTSDFEQENLIRSSGISPDTSYRHSSYNTLLEDVGESTPDPIMNGHKPPYVKQNTNQDSKVESFDVGPSTIFSSPWLMLLIFTIVIVSIYLYLNMIARNQEKSKGEEIKRDSRSIIEYNNMMKELP